MPDGHDMKSSVLNVFRQTWKVGGPRAVYKGLSWNIIGLPVDPLYIGSMEYARQVLHRYMQQHPGQIPSQYSDLFVTLTAGGAAAVVQQTLMVPIDVVTQRLMIQPTVPKEHVAALAAASSNAASTASSQATLPSSAPSAPPPPPPLLSLSPVPCTSCATSCGTTASAGCIRATR